ncbi:SecY subunit domain-containing protein [Phellopilus nigrolimitatus]|nr:SecY subunit domain-containing protein [Phellopilus nigrolimitatus]
MNKDLLDSDGDGNVEEEEALFDSEDEAEAEGDGEAKDDWISTRRTSEPQATVYVLTVLCSSPSALGPGVCLLDILQLVAAALIVILMSSFRRDMVSVWAYLSFWRNRLLNIMNLTAIVIIFGTVIYLQGFRLEIPVKSNRFRGQRGSYPVKLFYTSNMPIMLESALTSNVFIVSQMLASRFPDNLLVRILGLWEPLEDSPQLSATGGIVYCLSPPHMLRAALLDPIHSKIYITFIISVCALFSKIGVRCPARVRATMRSSSKNQQMVMAGHREGSMYKELKRVILTAAAFGDTIVGASSLPPPTSWALLAAALAYSWPSPSSSVTGKSAFVSQIARDGRVR